MRESDKASRKHISEHKKHSISEKTRSENPSVHSHKDSKEDPHSALLGRPIKSLGRKYLQENCFKNKEKQHHEIVISDELVRNSKLYRILREKIDIIDCVFARESHELSKTKQQLAQEVAEVRNDNHNRKLALWELKNQILELKGILNDEEEESRRLEAEINAQEQQYEEEQQQQRQEEMIAQQQCEANQKSLHSDEDQFQLPRGSLAQEQKRQLGSSEQIERGNLSIDSKGSEERGVGDIKMMMVRLHKRRLNPESQKKQVSKEQDQS